MKLTCSCELQRRSRKDGLGSARTSDGIGGGSGHRSREGGNGRNPPSNKIESGLITYSKTKSEARRNAVESSGISPDVKPLWIEEIDDENVEMEQKLRDKAGAGLHRWNTIKPKLVLEVYQHPDSYLVCLRADTARSYNERQPQGNAYTSGAEKAHYKVFYEKDSGRQETNQHHYFDEDD